MSNQEPSHDELPKAISSQKVFTGRVFSVTVDTVREGELTYQREVVHHGGSAVIVPVFDDGTVALVRQYRHPAVRYLLEVPAGTLATASVRNTAPSASYRRSSGSSPDEWRSCLSSLSRPVSAKRRCGSISRPNSCRAGNDSRDDECSTSCVLPISEALEMITSGEIQDAKTIIGLMLAAPKIGAPLFEVDYPGV
jgi:ADP-ribose pyrophosphatase